ncbi:MAG: DUF4123 domain-containing protein [Polyangiaceae bacterium]|nr:DUF4123 domain-containing protein [Polyangiaceae bacterium]
MPSGIEMNASDAFFQPAVEWFEELLWRDASDDVRVYAMIEGYAAPGLYGRLLGAPDLSWTHMYQGNTALYNLQNSPFLIALKRGHRFNRWLVEQGWGQGWGIYFCASTKAALDLYGPSKIRYPMFIKSTEETIRLGNLTEDQEDPIWLMRRHFRRFNEVEFEDTGNIVNFRYFDPATLRTYLPTCNADELRLFFGPVTVFFAEGFNELDSLNRSEHLYMFASPRGQDSKCCFWGRCFDMQTCNTQELQPHPAAEKPAGRNTGTFPMIRIAQCEAFREEVKQAFIQKVLDDLLQFGNDWGFRITKIEHVRNWIDDAIESALKLEFQNDNILRDFILAKAKSPASFDLCFQQWKRDHAASRLNELDCAQQLRDILG